MSVHLTEEEQLEVLKRWWKEYGKSIVIAVLVTVGGYYAFVAWQNQQREQKEIASAKYEDLLAVVSVQPGEALADEERTTAIHLASELKEGDSESLYAHNAALFLARIAVNAGELDEAASELSWVLANKPDIATEQVARLRLARVLIAQEKYDEAEELLATPVDAFKSEYSEASGDIAKARGDLDAARAAYEQALADTDPQQQERVMLLQLKRDDLKVQTNEVTQQTSVETTQ